MRHPLAIRNVLLFLVAITLLCATPTLADWFPTGQDLLDAKWIQMPDMSFNAAAPTGMDVLATLQDPQFIPVPGPPPLWKILADDFRCTETGFINDVHIWGSWLNDRLPQQGVIPGTTVTAPGGPGSVVFKLSIHSDVPAFVPTTGGPIVPSHPGEQLWQGIFGPGTYKVIPWGTASERFYDPNLDTHTPTGANGDIGFDTQVWQYNFKPISDPFFQTLGTIYWLDVQALVLDASTLERALFGWKTRDPDPTHNIDPSLPGDAGNGGGHFNDDAVFGDTTTFNGPVITGGGISGSGWTDMHYPFGHPLAGQTFDLAFVLTVPEPGTIALGGLGLVALVGMAYRRRRSAA